MKLFQGRKTSSFFGSSLYIFFIRFFPALVTLLIVILFGRKIDTNVNGDYQKFWINLNVLYTVACFGIHVFIITYPPDFVISLFRRITRKQYLAYSLWIILLGTVFAYFQYKDIHQSPFVPFTYLIMAALSLILESFLIVFRKFKTLIAINFIYSVIFGLLHYGIYAKAFHLSDLFLYLTILLAVRLFIFVFVARRKIKEQIFTPHDELSSETSSSVKSLWMHLGFNDVIQSLYNSTDKLIVSYFFSSRLLSYYYYGTFNIPFLAIILSSVTSAILLQITAIKNDDENTKVLKLLNHSARITSSIIFPIFFFFLIYRFEFFTSFFADKYLRSIPIFAVSVMVVPLKAYSFTTVLQNRHKGAIINIGAIADILIAVMLMYPLYKLFGFPGAALAFVLTTYAQATFYLYHSSRVLGVSMLKLIPVRNWFSKVIIFGSIFIGFHYFTVDHFSNLIGLILGVVLCIVVAAVALLFELNKSRSINGETV